MASVLFRRTTVARFLRYGSVSAISTVTSLLVLGLLVLSGWPAVAANLAATAVGTVPSFELNRRWVWGRRNERSFVHQVLPYCLLSLAGLVLSTLAVQVAADATAASTRLVHTAAIETANVGCYGTLWLIQFFLCDRVLFKDRVPRRDTGRAQDRPFTACPQATPAVASDTPSKVTVVTATP